LNITKENLRTFLGWCTVINLGILVLWCLGLIFAHDFVFRAHTWWFEISEGRFDEINYTMFMYYKSAVVFLNVIPYLILRYVKFT
jgi:hypothetical protein